MSDPSTPQAREPPVSEHLPYSVRMRLVQAAQTPITSEDRLARVRAIDKASQYARKQYPEFFNKETP